MLAYLSEDLMEYGPCADSGGETVQVSFADWTQQGLTYTCCILALHMQGESFAAPPHLF